MDPNIKGNLSLVIKALNGDTETLNAVETEADSGRFFASISTVASPPPFVNNDCRLSVSDGDAIEISAFVRGETVPFLLGSVNAEANPFAVVFDSLDGTLVDGAVVSIINATTGQPAKVYGLDGVTPWPSTITTGTRVTDANGQTVDLAPGEYRFPILASGNYRLVVKPPQPYVAPSAVSPDGLAGLRDGQGQPFDIFDGSYGRTFTVSDLLPIQIDIPLDAPAGNVTVTKRASRELVEPGDAVVYTVIVRNTDATRVTGALMLNDSASFGLRLRPDSIRVAGEPAAEAAAPAANGRGFSLNLVLYRWWRKCSHQLRDERAGRRNCG